MCSREHCHQPWCSRVITPFIFAESRRDESPLAILNVPCIERLRKGPCCVTQTLEGIVNIEIDGFEDLAPLCILNPVYHLFDYHELQALTSKP